MNGDRLMNVDNPPRRSRRSNHSEDTGRRFSSGRTTRFFGVYNSIPKQSDKHLEDISYIHGGLKIIYIDEAKSERHELHHPDGIVAYLDRLITDDKKKSIHEHNFAANKDEGKIRVEMVLRWTESTDEHIRSYVNGIRTRGGGTHESGFRSGIAKAVKNYMEVHNIKPKGINITPDDIREGIVGITSVFHNDPMFQGQTKDKLNNPEMTSLVDGIVRPGLESWLKQQPLGRRRSNRTHHSGCKSSAGIS